MAALIPLINATTSVLEEAKDAYDKVQNSNLLKMSFHQAGGQLAIVKTTLDCIKHEIETRNVGWYSDTIDAADTCIRTCCDNASFSLRAFSHVARAPDQERLKQYRVYLLHQDKSQRVEVLVREMLINTCELAELLGVERFMETDLKNLRWSIKSLDQAISKQDEEDENMRGMGGATRHGVGDMYSA